MHLPRTFRATAVAAALLVTPSLNALAPGRAAATVLGPTRLETLAFDPATGRVCYSAPAYGEETRTPVFEWRAFDLSGTRPGLAQPIEWLNRPVSLETPGWRDSMFAFRRTLQPLDSPLTLDLHVVTRVVGSDSARTDVGWVPRWRLDVTVTNGRLGAHAPDVVVWGNRAVGVSRVAQIPGDARQVAVLLFLGEPAEGGYEVEVPLLLEPGGAGRR